jgi:hypothetical protein
VTCEEAREFLHRRPLPKVVERHVAECAACRTTAEQERAFRDAYEQTMHAEPRARPWRLPISRLWLNILAFGFGIAIPVLLVLLMRSAREIEAEVLFLHALVIKGKVTAAERSDIIGYARREVGLELEGALPQAELEGIRLARLGPVKAAHLLYRKGTEPVTLLVFARSDAEKFADLARDMRLSRTVQDYYVRVQAGQRLVGVVLGRISEADARMFLERIP